MKNISLSTLLRRAMMALFCLGALAMFSACSDVDEPETGIDYYLLIESRVAIKGSGDIAPPPRENTIGILTSRMRQRIQQIYPHRNLQGDDAAVMGVCDEIYREYQEAGMLTNCECVATIYRARMSGPIVKQSVKIRSYRF